MAIHIRRLYADEAQRRSRELAQVLQACVAAGASVSFLHPFPLEAAERFYSQVAAAVAQDERILLAAFEELDSSLAPPPLSPDSAPTPSQLVGTVQLVVALPPNQPHRGEVAKLLVHPDHRGKGIGRLLMQQVEEYAREIGKTLLVLDTARGDAGEHLYRKLGWQETGVIPHFALYPDGTPCDTVVFYKFV